MVKIKLQFNIRRLFGRSARVHAGNACNLHVPEATPAPYVRASAAAVLGCVKVDPRKKPKIELG